MPRKISWLGCAVIAAVVCVSLVSAVSADWDPGDPFKMSSPQLPNGSWDCGFYMFTPPGPGIGNIPLADDWRCSESGPVSDIHFWYSWKDDVVADIESITIRIHEDTMFHPYGGPPEDGWAVPGALRWEKSFLPEDFTTRLYDTRAGRFFIPEDLYTWGTVENPNHYNIYQCNIEDILDPFYQQEDHVYWLSISVDIDPSARWQAGNFSPAIGWHISSLMGGYESNAVYDRWSEWYQIVNPEGSISGDPYEFFPGPDLAFVITPEPATLSLLALGGLALLRQRRK